MTCPGSPIAGGNRKGASRDGGDAFLFFRSLHTPDLKRRTEAELSWVFMFKTGGLLNPVWTHSTRPFKLYQLKEHVRRSLHNYTPCWNKEALRRATAPPAGWKCSLITTGALCRRKHFPLPLWACAPRLGSGLRRPYRYSQLSKLSHSTFKLSNSTNKRLHRNISRL